MREYLGYVGDCVLAGIAGLIAGLVFLAAIFGIFCLYYFIAYLLDRLV